MQATNTTHCPHCNGPITRSPNSHQNTAEGHCPCARLFQGTRNWDNGTVTWDTENGMTEVEAFEFAGLDV